MTSIEPHDFLTRVYRTAVAAADPRRATRQAVSALKDLAPTAWLFAIGKGAHAMASGAVESLRTHGCRIAGGLVVAHVPDESATHGLDAVIGDHPVPMEQSLAASSRLADAVARVHADDDAIVLVSGGATSLVAAPVTGIQVSELSALFTMLLASGSGIEIMNTVRKRVLQWGAGRLAVALPARRIHCFIASDVVGNDPAVIASGPCVPDPLTAARVVTAATAANLWNELPGGIRRQLREALSGRVAETPKPNHPRFATTSATIIVDRTYAVRAAAAEAQRLGHTVYTRKSPLVGDAATGGADFARRLVADATDALARELTVDTCVILSGETTVRLRHGAGRGGRCQEFALAFARALETAGPQSDGITLLAAGTDGRDGPTDAAGAIVDARTCEKMRRNGVDPSAALRAHESYHALEAAGALLKTGPTGTNVNDLVIALLLQGRGSRLELHPDQLH